MLISYRWLCELVPGLEAEPKELAKRLTSAGLAVDGLKPFGTRADSLFVGEVRRSEPHPTRDGLRLVTVAYGEREQVVVCGAPNVPDPGGLVVLAALGTRLPAVDMTMEPRKIGGVPSEGMLCSERELGLSDSASGLLTLAPGSARPGQLFNDSFPHSFDTIFDIDVTPNRPDALGHIGVAREVAASLGLHVALPSPSAPRALSKRRIEDLIEVDDRDPERCPHYGAAAVLGLSIGPSPLWLRWRLSSLGVRPISNVVDVTNLLLLEAGQPMHAFDRERLQGHRIIVRRAEPAEHFKTLDGVDHTLDPDDLVIADGQGAIALAGVMGGADSEIHDATRDVILECAYFSPRGIRRTARRHGMHTESSHRFERGIDWGDIDWVLDRAKALLTMLAGGEAVPGAIHVHAAELELPIIELRVARLAHVLGIEVPAELASSALTALGFEVLDASATELRVRGTSYRIDVRREIDLIEEVARHIGLDAIPAVLPAIPRQKPRGAHRFEREVCHTAMSLGLSEALTYAFVAEADLRAVKAPKAVVSLSNPLSEDRSVMRTSLLPGLLDALRRAHRRGQVSMQLFSVAPVFLPAPPNDMPSLEVSRPRHADDVGVLPEERPMLAVALAGSRPMHLTKAESVDIYDAKGVAVELVERLTRRTSVVEHVGGAPGYEHLHPRGAARVRVGGVTVGCFGPLHPEVADTLELELPVFVVEIDLAALERVGRQAPRYCPLARVPAVVRDLAIELPENVLAGTVESLIRTSAGELCESVELFDLFKGGSLPAGFRSLAFRITYRDPVAAAQPDKARTLTDKEVDACHARVVSTATAELGARLRG